MKINFTSPAAPAPARKMGANASIWLLASILVGFLAASSAPSPLYALYREAWGFSALTLTIVFSSYAFALLAALLIFGSLSDYRGRRDIILFALGLEIFAIILFLNADSTSTLIAARALQGLATGVATSALSAALIDIDHGRGALVNSVAPMIGMGVGALGSSVLVQFAPAPTKIVYLLFLIIFIFQTMCAWFLPETVSRRPGALRSLWPRIAIPLQARATMWQVLPVNTAQWALGGFYLSLGPTLSRLVTGNNAPVVGGAAIAALVFTSAVAIAFVRTHPAQLVLRGGTATLALGLAVTLSGIGWSSGATYFVGTAIAGIGFGAAFNGSLRSLVSLALPEQRGGLMAGFFALSYVAFSVPAIFAGLAIGYVGLRATAVGFGFTLMVLTLVALALMFRNQVKENG